MHRLPLSLRLVLLGLGVLSFGCARKPMPSGDSPAAGAQQAFTPPAISQIVVASVSATTATILYSTDTAVTTQVLVGTTKSYGSTLTPDASPTSAHTAILSGLTPGATYHFQIVAANDAGTSQSSDETFKTLDPGASALTISQIAYSATQTTATITWATSVAATTQVNYGGNGSTGTYPSSTALDSALVTVHSAVISGLQPATSLHFQVVSTIGGASVASTDQTLVTQNSVSPPSLFSISVSATNGTEATISWRTDVASSSQVLYGLSSAYGSASAKDATPLTTHSVTLTGLTPNRQYHFQVQSQNGGATGNSSDQTFLSGPVFTSLVPGSGGHVYGLWGTQVWAYSESSGWLNTGANGTTLGVGRDVNGNDELWLLDAGNQVWRYRYGAWDSPGPAHGATLVPSFGGVTYLISGNQVWIYNEATGWYFTGGYTDGWLSRGLGANGLDDLWLPVNGIAWLGNFTGSGWTWNSTGGGLSSIVASTGGNAFGIATTAAGKQIFSYRPAAGWQFTGGWTDGTLALGSGTNGLDEVWVLVNGVAWNGAFDGTGQNFNWNNTGGTVSSLIASRGGVAYGQVSGTQVYSYSPASGWASTLGAGTSFRLGVDPAGNDELWVIAGDGTVFRREGGNWSRP